MLARLYRIREPAVTMNDPRDFLALARYGNLGVLILGVGLLGVLIHRKPLRQAISMGVCLLGILLVFDGAALMHRETLSLHGSVVVILVVAAVVLIAIRSVLSSPSRKKTEG